MRRSAQVAQSAGVGGESEVRGDGAAQPVTR